MTARKIHPYHLQPKPRKRCIQDGCDGLSRSKLGYCDAHAKRLKKGLDMTAPIKRRNTWDKACTVEGCGREVRGSGLCSGHYTQFYRGKEFSPLRLPSIHNEIGLPAAHHRVTYLWGSAKNYPCVECGNQAKEWAYDGADHTELLGDSGSGNELMTYSRYPEFYMPMCKSCHSRRDGASRSAELREYRTWKNRTGQTLAAEVVEPSRKSPIPMQPAVVLATLGVVTNPN